VKAKDTKAGSMDISGSPIHDASVVAHRAIDDAANAVAPAAAWVTEKTGQWNTTQKALRKDTSKTIARNPLKAVGIALVAGILLGRLFW
jgi:ElaB/YqjD/DUF883 family membrane-anchored ribosome-binding protein